jgi:HSP20 family protein
MIIVRFRNPSSRQNSSLPENPYNTIGVVNWRLNVRPHLWRPSTDLIEKEDSYIVRAEIAGMSEEEFNISVDGEVLTISGNRRDAGERRAFHQMEIQFGEFITQVQFPNDVDHQKISAEYKDGFLRVNLPKAQTREIKIGSD